MTQTTEAACLLQSGSMYSRRIGLRTSSGEDWFAGVKLGAVSLYFGDEPIFHFDFDGRWQRAFVEGVHYLKGLDGAVRSIDRDREGGGMVLVRGTLDYAGSVDLDDSIRSVALDLIDDLDQGRLEILAPPSGASLFKPEALRTFLERVAGWDSTAWFAQRERHLAAYRQVPFLPPDCSNALVLQATVGHSGGRLFGGAPSSEFLVRSAQEFRDHARLVQKLIGRRGVQYQSAFLGGSDVLHQPVQQILQWLAIVEQVFPHGASSSSAEEYWSSVPSHFTQFHAFLDDFVGSLPDLDGWQKLRSALLSRVTLGVESGDAETRSLYGKTWKDEDLRRLIRDLKAAGIRVGLVTLLGAGGKLLADRHVDATAELLASLPLGSGDLVTLVDSRRLRGSSRESPDDLTSAEVEKQATVLKARTTATRSSKGPKLVVYNSDK